MDRIDRIGERLQQLREADPYLQSFGAATHRYALAPAMPEIAIAPLEEAIRVRIPDEYRAFLTRLGSSGAGPGYGLLPIQPLLLEGFPSVTSTVTTKDGKSFSAGTGKRPSLARVSDPSRPFPLAKAFRPTEESLAADANPYDGCLKLAEIGCGYFYFLVATGPSQGQVWADYTAGDGEIAPLGVGFLEWYENWLAENIFTAAVRSMRTQILDDARWTAKPEVLRHSGVIEECAARWADHAPTVRGLGYLRLYERRFDDAVALFEKSAALVRGQDVESEIGLCVSYRMSGRPERIPAVLERAWSRKPVYFPHVYELRYWNAVGLRLSGRLAEAAAAAEEAIHYGFLFELAYVELAVIRAALGDWSGVEKTVERIAVLNQLQRFADNAVLLPQDMPKEKRVPLCYWAFSNVLAQNGLAEAAAECRRRSGF